jgi:hypothetical protein
MFDQSIRSIWLREQLWPALRTKFPEIATLPEEALITVGYPSSGARGRSEKIKPAEINSQWTGNANERVFIGIHPVYFDSSQNMAKALLFQASKSTMGPRWGPNKVGLTKEDDGTINASFTTQQKIDDIIKDIGEPPSGQGIAFPVREVSRARLRRYICDVPECNASGGGGKHPIIRAASDTLAVKCEHCGESYHAG